jgi:hypothetical protein
MMTNFVLRMSLIAGLAAGACLGLGCGDDDGGGSGADGGGEGPDGGGSAAGSGGGGPTIEPGMTAEKEISAAEGGEVALGPVTLTIPAGALAEDTTITVEVLDKDEQPGADDIVADVFDFGPDGTEFLEPVTLELDVGNLQVPSGQQAVLAFLDGQAWVALEDSELAGGKVTATTTHFTPFTVVLVVLPDGGVGQVGGGCGSVDDFDACGGDLTGTWNYTGACVTLPPDALGGGEGDDNPFAMCTDAPMLAATVDLTGTTTFGADGSFSLDQTLTLSSEITIPASCIDQLTGGMDPAMACEMILEGMLNADGACVSALDEPEVQMNMETGTWSADEATGELMIVDSSPDGGGASDDVILYCVTGNTVKVLLQAGDGAVIEYMATRQ